MNKTEKTKYITKVVINSIWLAVSLFMYFGGLYVFIDMGKNFGAWMMWGIFCAIIIIPFIYKFTKKSTKDSARDGANTYSVSVSGNSATVSNHPFLGAVFGFVVGIFLSLAFGPIVAAGYIIKTIVTLIKNISALVKSV